MNSSSAKNYDMNIAFIASLHYSSFYTGCMPSASVTLLKHLPSTLTFIARRTLKSDNTTRVYTRQIINKIDYSKMTSAGSTNKRQQPPWMPPAHNESDVPKLMLYNSLTRKKEVLIPQDPNRKVHQGQLAQIWNWTPSTLSGKSKM